MDPSFGTRLRQQREEQQVSLAAIAERTKIRVALLEGLERDDTSHWPMGVFRRSYFRAYAEAIGLKSDALLQEFLLLRPDPSEEIPVVAAAAQAAIGEKPGRRPPTRLRFLLGSAMRALPALRQQPPASHSVSPASVAHDEGDSVKKPVRVEREFSLVAPPRYQEPEPEMPRVDGPEPIETDHPEIVPAAALASVELSAVAQLCTRLARATDSGEVAPVLHDAARLIDAVGLVLWMWDTRASALMPVLTHGYSGEILAELHGVLLDDDNAITAAFRSAETRVVYGGEVETGAVVVPLTTPSACAGVLALELRNGGEQQESVRAFAAILAAQLSTLIGYPPVLQAATA